MDVNAGQYLDGTPMDVVGEQTLELTVDVASGNSEASAKKPDIRRCKYGGIGGKPDATKLETLLQAEPPSGQPLDIVTDASDTPPNITFTRSDSGHAGNQIGLILPTSLCSGQVGHLIAMHLNRKKLGQPDRISQFVALAHTEGCGNSAGQNEEMYARTMVGYATHPLVKHCLLLEHGCEKTHNAFMRHQLEDRGQDPDRLGYASIQLDGGIDNVTQKVERWFAEQLAADRTVEHDSTGLHGLRIGLMSAGTASKEEARQLARLTRWIVQAGGTVVVPENSPLLRHADYRDQLLGSASVRPSLAYGDSVRHPGFHIMEAPTSHWVETMTGLAATGVELIVASVSDRPLQTHPFVPVMQLTSHPATQQKYERDLDLALVGSSDSWALDILQRSKDIIERRYVPELYRQGNIAFQFTRGELGVSL